MNETYGGENLKDLGRHLTLIMSVFGDADQLPGDHGEGWGRGLQVGWGWLLHQGGDVLIGGTIARVLKRTSTNTSTINVWNINNSLIIKPSGL